MRAYRRVYALACTCHAKDVRVYACVHALTYIYALAQCECTCIYALLTLQIALVALKYFRR